MKFTLIPLCFFILTACTSNNNTKAPVKTVIPLSSSDATLLNQACQNSILLVKMAEEANTRCTTGECKKLAETITLDNKKILDELKVIAGKHGTETPLDISDDQLKKWHELVREKGIGFDKKFAEMINLEYDHSIAVFKNVQQQATDKDLQILSSSFIEDVKLHMQQGLDLQETLNNRRSRDSSNVVQQVSDEQ